jgi:hypothetical protein
MSRIVPHGDMSASEIVQCSYDAMAIVALCENTAWDIAERGPNGTLVGNMNIALKLALELMGAVHDALENHEGLSEEDRHERAA